MKNPSLKNIVLIILAAIIVGVAFFVAEYRNKQSQNMLYSAVTLSTTTDAISSDAQNLDSDHDGLKDWEEVLLGTDPHNPDTDGDGTPDGEEVRLGRNPLVKGPNDKMSSTNSMSAIPEEKLTPTDRLARDFFARYMELHQAGLDTDQYSQQQLISQVLANGMVLEVPKVYTQKNIVTTKNTDLASIKKYGNDLGAIFGRYPIPGRDEALIVKDSFDKNDPNILKEIDPKIISYKNIINALLKVETPQTLTQMHIDLVNSFSGFLFIAESLRQSGDDPLKGIGGVVKYTDVGTSLLNSMQNLRDYMSTSNISYSISDPGSLIFASKKSL